MPPTEIEEVITILLAAVESERLVIVSGAGLSMPEPSDLPSARELAAHCANKHAMVSGDVLSDELREDIEAQAQYFRERAQLESYFLERLVDWKPFFGEPNEGHYAIADLLLCRAADLSVSANVDTLVERAAEELGETDFEACIRGSEAAVPRHYQPLLKIHGCARRGRRDTLWCREQLQEPEWQARILDTARWLTGRLSERDLVFVGYWTDWAYLNEVLAQVIENGRPRSVTLIDPSPPEALRAKAPDLWNWAHRDGIAFHHLQIPGTEFLQKLRHRFSYLLLKRIAAVGAEAFERNTSSPCPSFPILDSSSNEDLYDLRRDWSGVRRDQVTRRRDAEPSDELLSKTLCDLLAAGAITDGALFITNGRRVRLFQASGRMLYTVKAELSGDTTSFDAPEVTVCVGAYDDGGVPENLVRSGRGSTIIRPGISGEWCTHEKANDILGI